MLGAVALATFRPGLPDMGQATLNRYLVHLRQVGRPATLLEMRFAGNPRSFTRALSGPTFGDGVYYGVSYTDAGAVVNANAPRAAATSVLDGMSVTYTSGIEPVASYGSQRPMPYPPEEIWCVRLQPEAGGAPEAVLLARHEDLYNGSWAVHELPPETGAQTLAQVGCAWK